jgi:hypothetical protein
VTDTIMKIRQCCGFRRTGKAMEQMYQCWWRICREINVFFFRFEDHIFHVLCQFVTYLLTLPRIYLRAITNQWDPQCILDDDDDDDDDDDNDDYKITYPYKNCTLTVCMLLFCIIQMSNSYYFKYLKVK